MKTGLPIKHFSNYRAYLIAYAQTKKSENPRWSFGVWAKKLGLKSTSSITKIIQGQREPGPELTEILTKYFQFSPQESQYFQDLVRLNKVQNDPRLAALLMEKMGKEHPNGSVKLMDDKSFAVVSNWYCLAIREMIRMQNFVEDADWISKKFIFKVTPRQVTQAIKNLLATGLLKRNSNGYLEVSEPRVHTTSDISSEAIKRYHEEMLENAKTTLRKVNSDQREITSSTLVVSKKNYAQAKEKIREFREQFVKYFEETHGDEVYQIQIQFFPLTKSINLNKRSIL